MKPFRLYKLLWRIRKAESLETALAVDGIGDLGIDAVDEANWSGRGSFYFAYNYNPDRKTGKYRIWIKEKGLQEISPWPWIFRLAPIVMIGLQLRTMLFGN